MIYLERHFYARGVAQQTARCARAMVRRANCGPCVCARGLWIARRVGGAGIHRAPQAPPRCRAGFFHDCALLCGRKTRYFVLSWILICLACRPACRPLLVFSSRRKAFSGNAQTPVRTRLCSLDVQYRHAFEVCIYIHVYIYIYMCISPWTSLPISQNQLVVHPRRGRGARSVSK